jgi:ribosomal protein S18 acetylase RimI-like enzyme
MSTDAPRIRRAHDADARRLAELHAGRITEGFLSSLGAGFLARLYRRIVRSPDGFAFVADQWSADGVVGFAAGVMDVGRLYRSFLVRDAIPATVAAAPRLASSWRRVLETLRYPAEGTDDLPGPEVLAVAVGTRAAGHGLGRALVDATLDELTRRGAVAVRVVVGADNTPALALYTRCGFVPAASIAVHEGTPSEVLVWSSASH